jgi:threonine dehydrogenase-like Zn-dependent dehydrogenase
VVNILCRATVRPGDDVAVVGVGFLGAMLVQACARAGARVFAVSRREESLDVAKCMGAAETMRSDDAWAVVQAVKRVTNGRMLKTVIECTGLQGPLDLAGELVGERGRLVIAGYHQDGLRQVNLQQWNWKGIDVINAHERDPAVYRAGMEAAIVAVVEGRMNPETLYTHKLPLDRLALAFQLMEERPAGFMKALLTYDTP